MKSLNKSANLTILALMVIALGSIVFFQYGTAPLERIIKQDLAALLAAGKDIAGALGDEGFPGLAIFVVGNLFLSCLIFLSTQFYSFLHEKSRLVRIVISGSTLLTGLSLMVIQAGFCMGFPQNAISEGLKSFSTILFSIQGILISFAPLYYSQKAKSKYPHLLPQNRNKY